LVRHTILALAIASTLGLAAAPSAAIQIATSGSEALSALLTGTVLLLLAAAAKRVPARKQ
jgi:hypothetical protein